MKEKIQKKEWNLIFYEDEKGCPVRDFLMKLGIKDRKKITDKIEQLKEEGIKLQRPQCAFLRDGIYELRVRLQNIKQTRTLYFFYNNNNEIVLTHTFIKKTDKVPENEINKALKIKEKYLQQQNKK